MSLKPVFFKRGCLFLFLFGKKLIIDLKMANLFVRRFSYLHGF